MKWRYGSMIPIVPRTALWKKHAKKIAKPPKEFQDEQLQKITVASSLCAKLKKPIESGFLIKKRNASALNTAVKIQIKIAITGIYPALKVDF